MKHKLDLLTFLLILTVTTVTSLVNTQSVQLVLKYQCNEDSSLNIRMNLHANDFNSFHSVACLPTESNQKSRASHSTWMERPCEFNIIKSLTPFGSLGTHVSCNLDQLEFSAKSREIGEKFVLTFRINIGGKNYFSKVALTMTRIQCVKWIRGGRRARGGMGGRDDIFASVESISCTSSSNQIL